MRKEGKSVHTLGRRIAREGVLGLGHAQRQVSVARGLVRLDLLLGRLRVLHPVPAVHLLHDGVQLLLQEDKRGDERGEGA